MTQSGSTWSTTVSLPQNTAIQYKYIEKDSSGNVTWEPGANHSATTGSGSTATLTDGYNGSSRTVAETFDENAATWYGQNVYLVGSLPALGAWNTADARTPLLQHLPGLVGHGDAASQHLLRVQVHQEGSRRHRRVGVERQPHGHDGYHSQQHLGSERDQPRRSDLRRDEATSLGQNVYVVGSIAGLGFWDPNSAIPLSSANYPVWSTTISLSPNTYFEYKYIVKGSFGNVTWESGSNRSYTTGASGSVTLNDAWK
jgi:alpha-amylase